MLTRVVYLCHERVFYRYFKERELMSYIPVALNLANRNIVIIGGGKVATQKMSTLLKYDASISIFAKKVSKEIRNQNVQWSEVDYSPDLLCDANLVYAATDNPNTNKKIASDARSIGALVNVVDDPSNCDFVSPAIEKRDTISIAVTSNGTSVKESIAMRNKIREMLDD